MSTDYDARLYAAVHDGNPGDVEFYAARARGAGSVLELGCGDARVLAALGNGACDLVGVDLDPSMLELAAGRTSAVELIHADMADPDLLRGRGFDRVFVPHGGIYCVLDAARFDALLANIARLLKPGGELVLDAWAADAFHRESRPEDEPEGWIERVKSIEIDGDAWEVLERSRWDRERQRIDVTYLHVRVGDEQAVEGVLRQRYVTSEQLSEGLRAHGLELVSIRGGFAGEPFDDDATLMVVVARKPG